MLCAVLLGTAVEAREPEPGCSTSGEERDNKTVAGVACVVDQPSSYWSNEFYYSWRGGVCNLSPKKDLKVRCPIVRDAVGNDNGIGCVKVHFRDEDLPPGSLSQNHVGREVECALRALKPNGDFVYPEDGGESILTNSTGPNVLLDVIVMHLNHSSPGGYYLLSCNLPERTEKGGEFCLQSINWSEFQPTD